MSEIMVNSGSRTEYTTQRTYCGRVGYELIFCAAAVCSGTNTVFANARQSVRFSSKPYSSSCVLRAEFRTTSSFQLNGSIEF